MELIDRGLEPDAAQQCADAVKQASPGARADADVAIGRLQCVALSVDAGLLRIELQGDRC